MNRAVVGLTDCVPVASEGAGDVSFNDTFARKR